MNPNTRDLQRIKQSLLQQSTILNDTDCLRDEDELTQSQNTKNRNTNTLEDQTLAIQYPTKSDYCNQQVQSFDPSFFKYKRYFLYFFLPEDTQITIETIQSQQNQVPVLQKVYHWLKINERPLQIDPTIASNSSLSVYCKFFNQLYINHDTKIIHIDYPFMIQTQIKRTKFAYHLHTSMQLSIKFMHMDTRELKYP